VLVSVFLFIFVPLPFSGGSRSLQDVQEREVSGIGAWYPDDVVNDVESCGASVFVGKRLCEEAGGTWRAELD